MSERVSITSRDVLAKLLPVFERMEGGSVLFRESLGALQSIHHLEPVDEARSLSLDNCSYRNLYHLLANCLNQARILQSVHLCEAFSILADASREREWNSRGHWTSADAL
jgi:hypothetical protein